LTIARARRVAASPSVDRARRRRLRAMSRRVVAGARALQRELDLERLARLVAPARDASSRARAVNDALVAQLAELARATPARACDVAPSTAGRSGASAGDGLFARGAVAAGRVVATYPGLTYVGAATRFMKDYPRVTRENEYLIARSDGSVIDAEPWGRGGENDDAWPGAPVALSEAEARRADGASWLERLRKPTLPRATRARLARECATLDRGDELALAHYANHPPSGTAPNVVVASVDVPRDSDARRRTQNVNVECEEEGEETESVWSIVRDGERSLVERARDASLAMFGEDADKPRARGGTVRRDVVRGLVLVSTRDIEDGEEIWLNYRLSTHVTPPAWYVRVDPEEDERRWSLD
jgi:hypothetical protein